MLIRPNPRPHQLPDSAGAAAARRPSFTAATLLVAAVVLMASLAIPSQVRGATFTFAPTADSYVTNASGQTTTNFGTQSTLQVGASPTRHAFLMFNVTGLTGAPTSATLMLWAVSASGGASAASTTTAWAETTINNTNAPAIGSAVSTVTTITAGTWVSFNVTTLVTGSASVAVAFTSSNTTGVVFASREDATHAPQLVVGAGAATVPDPPTNVTAVPGNGSATVSWSAPANTGGNTITGYTVTSSGGQTATTTGATSANVTLLTNGTSYTFTVTATNTNGTGGPSTPPSAAVTPSNPPDPPTNVTAVPGNGSATVSWSAPANNGGNTITGYTVTSSGGQTATTTGATSANVTLLTNGTSYTFTVRATNSVGPGPASAASNAVTPSASLPVFRRMPYLTDTTTTSTLVNFATSAASPLPTVRWGLASGNCVSPPNTVTATVVATLSGMPAGTDYQVKAAISGLSANTAYCYRVFQNSVDLLGASVSFTTALAANSATPFTFAVVGDWGQGGTAEANVFSQIAAGHPNFLMTVGDNVYNGGSNAEYGDLNGGNVFPAGYVPKLGGAVPIFAAQGNHGFSTNLPYLQTFPQNATVAASGGTFAVQSYCCAAGTSGTNNYASAWYAFTWGRARFYVLEAAFADGNGAYQGDFTSHWNGPVSGCTPCGQEMSWLQTDLLNNASVPLKFAFFHYPIYSDSSSQGSDTYLNGAAPHLEGVLAANNVGIVFTGHAHQYERNIKQAGGPLLVNYVTGGGGAALGSVSSCHTWDAYAIGSSGHCGAAPASNPRAHSITCWYRSSATR